MESLAVARVRVSSGWTDITIGMETGTCGCLVDGFVRRARALCGCLVAGLRTGEITSGPAVTGADIPLRVSFGTPPRFRSVWRPSAYDSDYKGSGYSRGHMAPAADFGWSKASIRATFLLSNAVP